MDGLDKAMDILLDEIKKSSAYTRFETARMLMEEHPEAKAKVDSFRSWAYELSNTDDPLDPPQQMEELAQERLRVRQDPLSAEYLDSEMDLCRMLQKICLSVISVIDLQIEPFEKKIMRG